MTTSPWVRALLVGAIALVVGLVLGGLGPRSEVRRLQDQVFELEREAARRPPAITRELSRILGAQPEAARPEPVPVVDRGADDVPRSEDPRDEEIRRDARELEELEDLPPPEPRDPAEELALVRDTLEVRAAQARAALYEDIDPTPAQMDVIDAAVEDMNDALYGVTRAALDRASTAGDLTRRDMMALGADVLDVLVTAEDRMLESMTPAQRDVVRPEATDPTAFVDPGLVDLAAEFEGVIPPRGAP